MFASIVDWDNLWLAYRRAAKGKRSTASVARFEFLVADRLVELQAELQAKTYRPGPYTHFTIHEPKRRKISAAPFRDRVVHHALCNVIEPLFEQRFIADSYANRVGKGTHKAIDRLQQFSRRYRYVLRMDVVQHFPSLDHAILRGAIAEVIHDEDVLWLVDGILSSGAGVLADEYTMVYFPGDDLFAAGRPRGLPIGNLTSQFWSNVYMTGLDHFVLKTLQCPAYLRYVDDFALFSDSKTQLWEWKHAVIDYLATQRLTVHETAAQVQPVATGIPWLGFVVYPHPSSAETAQRRQLHAPLPPQHRSVQQRSHHFRRVRCQCERLDQPRALRRHMGTAENNSGREAPHSPSRPLETYRLPPRIV